MMKPLSERIKSFSADQFIDWLCLACVDVREVRTEEDAQEEINTIRSVVTERLSALEQRAEAAESRWFEWKEQAIKAHGELTLVMAKLAELEKQEPVAWCPKSQVDTLKKHSMVEADLSAMQRFDEIPLFTRPAPALSLAELVPPEEKGWQTNEFKSGRNSMRADILRNIEEQSQ